MEASPLILLNFCFFGFLRQRKKAHPATQRARQAAPPMAMYVPYFWMDSSADTVSATTASHVSRLLHSLFTQHPLSHDSIARRHHYRYLLPHHHRSSRRANYSRPALAPCRELVPRKHAVEAFWHWISLLTSQQVMQHSGSSAMASCAGSVPTSPAITAARASKDSFILVFFFLLVSSSRHFFLSSCSCCWVVVVSQRNIQKD